MFEINERKLVVSLICVSFILHAFVDSTSKIYTFSPRTQVPGHPSESSTMSYLPNKPGRNKADDGASTSARGTGSTFHVGIFINL